MIQFTSDRCDKSNYIHVSLKRFLDTCSFLHLYSTKLSLRLCNQFPQHGAVRFIHDVTFKKLWWRCPPDLPSLPGMLFLQPVWCDGHTAYTTAHQLWGISSCQRRGHLFSRIRSGSLGKSMGNEVVFWGEMNRKDQENMWGTLKCLGYLPRHSKINIIRSSVYSSLQTWNVVYRCESYWVFTNFLEVIETSLFDYWYCTDGDVFHLIKFSLQ